jgi:hypothetical protein
MKSEGICTLVYSLKSDSNNHMVIPAAHFRLVDGVLHIRTAKTDSEDSLHITHSISEVAKLSILPPDYMKEPSENRTCKGCALVDVGLESICCECRTDPTRPSYRKVYDPRRDMFAAAALTGLIAHYGGAGRPAGSCASAWGYADEMIAKEK